MIADNQADESSKINTDLEIEKPKRYYVIMHNDDTTPFDFVIEVLVQLFHHTPETAADLASKIHNEGTAIVGMYYLEVAEQKVEETISASRRNGFTLTVSLEAAE